MGQTLTLAVAQFSWAIGKAQENLAAIARLCAAASEKGAQFVLFPEDCVTGYPADKGAATRTAVTFNGAEIQQVGGLARKHRLTIAAGFIERHGDVFHSSHAILERDGTRSIIRKRSVDERDQRIGLIPSHAENPDISISGVSAAMCICMDGTDEFFTAAKSRGVRIILHPSGGACGESVHAGEANAGTVEAAERTGCGKCVESAQARAKSLDVVYCVANPVGFDGARGYPGNSFIVGRDGQVLALLEGTATIEKMREAVGVARVDLA